MDDWKSTDHTNYDALAAYFDAIATDEEWKRAVTAEMAQDDHLEDTLELESWMEDEAWIRGGC